MTLDPERCYAAHTARDSRFDGVFFTGVGTTGIYCRPICPARTPRASSCTFFPSAASAEAAGFRPCLRCRPELAPGWRNASLPQELLHRLQSRAAEGLTLEEMEPELGLSTRQVRRLILEHFGVPPSRIIATQRLLLAKQLLTQTDKSISTIALACGFRSLKAFQSSFTQNYQLVPSDFRKPGQKQPVASDITLRLSYRPPLAWAALLRYFQSRLVPGVEEISEQTYRRTVQLGKARGWISVQNDAQKAQLIVSIAPSLVHCLGAIQTRVRQMFDLDASPLEIAAVLKKDAILGPIATQTPGLRVGGAWDTFELAVRAVLGQQITVKAATTLSGRLAERIGEPLATPFPLLKRLGVTPEALLRLNQDELCQLGLVSKRAQALRHLAEFTLQGGLTFPPGMDHESAAARLVALPGIGPWTAHYIAMRALRFPDAFPAADLGLRKALGNLPTADCEALSQSWRPWRAYAAITLWHSLPAL